MVHIHREMFASLNTVHKMKCRFRRNSWWGLVLKLLFWDAQISGFKFDQQYILHEARWRCKLKLLIYHKILIKNRTTKCCVIRKNMHNVYVLTPISYRIHLFPLARSWFPKCINELRCKGESMSGLQAHVLYEWTASARSGCQVEVPAVQYTD